MNSVQGKQRTVNARVKVWGTQVKKEGAIDINRFPLNGLSQGIFSPLT